MSESVKSIQDKCACQRIIRHCLASNTHPVSPHLLLGDLAASSLQFREIGEAKLLVQPVVHGVEHGHLLSEGKSKFNLQILLLLSSIRWSLTSFFALLHGVTLLSAILLVTSLTSPKALTPLKSRTRHYVEKCSVQGSNSVVPRCFEVKIRWDVTVFSENGQTQRLW